jgi:hypothetical protein
VKKKEREKKDENSAEQVDAGDALARMKAFADRKENFIAAIKKSKDRDLSARTRKK